MNLSTLPNSNTVLLRLLLGLPTFLLINLPLPSQSQSPCIVYGPFYLDVSQPHDFFNLTFYAARDESSLRRFLDNALANGYRVILNLAGSRRHFQDSAGKFSLVRFRDRLKRFANFDFTPYQPIIICHLLFDEPHDPNNWGGTIVHHPTIDSAAAFSKALFPSLATGVGAPATWLSQYGTYQHLDYAKPQYSIAKGDIDEFIAFNHAAAQTSNLRIIYSLNVLSGWYQRQRIPAQALEELSQKLLQDSLADGLLYWKYESSYFNNPEIQAACQRVRDTLCSLTSAPTIGTSPPSIQVFVHPNQFSIRLPKASSVMITLYNLQGQILGFQQAIGNTVTFNLHHLRPGFYAVKIQLFQQTIHHYLLKTNSQIHLFNQLLR